LKLAQVVERTGRQKSSIYSDRTFPSRVHVGRSSYWVEGEIEAWMAAQVFASRGEESVDSARSSGRKRPSILEAGAAASSSVRLNMMTEKPSC
jgi:predicted DNA-binding transcriptional regulator AlpA